MCMCMYVCDLCMCIDVCVLVWLNTFMQITPLKYLCPCAGASACVVFLTGSLDKMGGLCWQECLVDPQDFRELHQALVEERRCRVDILNERVLLEGDASIDSLHATSEGGGQSSSCTSGPSSGPSSPRSSGKPPKGSKRGRKAGKGVSGASVGEEKEGEEEEEEGTGRGAHGKGGNRGRRRASGRKGLESEDVEEGADVGGEKQRSPKKTVADCLFFLFSFACCVFRSGKGFGGAEPLALLSCATLCIPIPLQKGKRVDSPERHIGGEAEEDEVKSAAKKLAAMMADSSDEDEGGGGGKKRGGKKGGRRKRK